MNNEINLITPSKEVILNWFNTPIIKLLLKGKMYSSLEDIPVVTSVGLEIQASVAKTDSLFENNPSITRVGILEVRGHLYSIYVNNEKNVVGIFNSYNNSYQVFTKLMDGLEKLLAIITNTNSLEFHGILDISLLQLTEFETSEIRRAYAYFVEIALNRCVLQTKTVGKNVEITHGSSTTMLSWENKEKGEKCNVLFELIDETYDLKCEFMHTRFFVKDKRNGNRTIRASNLNLVEFIDLINSFKNKGV